MTQLYDIISWTHTTFFPIKALLLFLMCLNIHCSKSQALFFLHALLTVLTSGLHCQVTTLAWALQVLQKLHHFRQTRPISKQSFRHLLPAHGCLLGDEAMLPGVGNTSSSPGTAHTLPTTRLLEKQRRGCEPVPLSAGMRDTPPIELSKSGWRGFHWQER